MNTKTLHYAFYTPGASGYGWATCNNSLIKELQNHFALVNDPVGADVCFMPLADHNLNPATQATGKVRLAYTFFESPLGPDASRNAALYDCVFCGSSWCLDRLKDAGISNTKVLIQGVDGGIFQPGPRRPDHQFRIFSGGKFERRKGQDIAVEAFREFLKHNPDAHLVCAWHNPWPNLIPITVKKNGEKIHLPQEELFTTYLLSKGIPREAFTILPKLEHTKLCAEMQNTDVGLFTNRCEGGTNLVLMEYLATGNPAVANIETGHKDLWDAKDANGLRSNIFPFPAGIDSNHWAIQDPAHVALALETARTHGRNRPSQNWTWAQAAEKIAREAQAIASLRKLW